MPLKVTENAWVKIPPQPTRRRKRVDPLEAKEAMCAPLRYFSCTPMNSKDRIRMLSRPVSGMSGMLAIERPPSPVEHDEGAGLMFSNGSRGGSNGGRRSRRLDRIVSEPVQVLEREPSVYEADEQQGEEEIVEVIEELSTVADDTKSHRSYRSHRSHCCQHSRRSEPHPAPEGASSRHNETDPIPTPTSAVRSFSPPPPSVASYKSHRDRHRDDYSYSDMQSNRSASPPASIASYKIRHREREPLPPPTLPASQARTPYRTVSTPAAAPRPTIRTRVPDHNQNGYKFESAIFQPKASSSHYRDVYRSRGSQAGSEGGRWASATSALSFD